MERMSPRLMRALSHAHRWIYRTTHGRLGGTTADGYPVLLLSTRGRRTGATSTTPLVYFRDGSRLVACGGSGGTVGDPGWVLNVRACNQVGVQVGGDCFAAEARELAGTERDELWRRMSAAVPRMTEYQRRVQRRVPLVSIERRSSAAG